MDYIVVLLTALGLSMDAFAAAISNSIAAKKNRVRTAVVSAAAFGIAQGLMPLLGYLAGRTFEVYIRAIDHWIALALLAAIGIKMVVDAVREIRAVKAGKDEKPGEPAEIPMSKIILQALATSIDALAVGVSFALLETNIVLAVATIAVITFVMCLIGAAIGNRLGGLFKEKAEIVGGLVLVGIGLKIFIEHMFF